MFLMSLFFVLRIIRILLSAYLFVLTVRVVLDWVALLSRWQPGRIAYPVVNAVYTSPAPDAAHHPSAQDRAGRP